jgi:enoyl-CoA hydratase/carnithine racemase
LDGQAMSDILKSSRDGNLATLTLNRPEKRNALNVDLRVALSDALDDLAKDDAVSVVILTGAGTAFCAGFDLSEFEQKPGAFGEDERVWTSGKRMHETLQAFPKPLIAAVNGPALAGGFDVAVQADARIASESAIFGHPEIKFGAPTLYTNLSYVVAGAHARDLALSGRRIDANEAHRIGLVMQVVPAERLVEETFAYARVVAEAPLIALKAVKEAIVASTPFRMP